MSLTSITRFLPRSLLLRGAVFIIALQLGIALLTRFILLAVTLREVDWNLSLPAAFVGGAWFDFLAGLYATVPWLLIAVLIPSVLWRSKLGRITASVVAGLYGLVFVFITVAEFLFWDEFQVRFNFIAVDYLVFTQEVIQNIQQSYPMPLIFGGLTLVAALIALAVWKSGVAAWITAGEAGWRSKLLTAPAAAVVVVGISFAFSQSQLPHFANDHHRELAKNGIYSFCAAFWESEIDYDRFYLKKPVDQTLAHARELLATPSAPLASTEPHDLRRVIRHEGPEKKWNVVLISVESLSAEFLTAFGNKKGLTPHLDRMASEGILLRELYATGTRTVRGLEALTLSVPPTPGQSIVWRPKNEHLFTLGSLFGERGYDVAYVYGGDAMFDNMNTFFGNNGYRVVDRMKKTEKDWVFNNAWGVADEDLMRWTMQEADAAHASGKAFFVHAMTVSNHRPFTFPEGRIDMPSNSGRDAAVKYTDYAIGSFVEQAKTKPWFANTLFVVVADHCHGSAGKMELDVSKYRIPCIFWNPALVKPYLHKSMCSQIDVAPTLLGLMNWTYTSRFYGHDVFAPGYGPENQRAFISNYQKIAELTPQSLVILKPKQETLAYRRLDRTHFEEVPASDLQPRLDDTVSLYQSASWIFRNGHLDASTAMP